MGNPLTPNVLGGPLRSEETLSQKAYDRIRDAVLANALPPGVPISEPSISKQLGLSRATLREALVRLEAERYVVRSSTGRWRVARMDRTAAEEIYQCRGALEGLAARLAAERRDSSYLDAMANELRRLRRSYSSGDVTAAAKHSTRFHDLVIEAAGSKKLHVLMNILRPQLLQNRFLMLRHNTRDSSFLDQNEQLCKAIAEGRRTDAERIARKSAEKDIVAVLNLFDQGILGEGDES